MTADLADLPGCFQQLLAQSQQTAHALAPKASTGIAGLPKSRSSCGHNAAGQAGERFVEL
jgi:hypothetical protein